MARVKAAGGQLDHEYRIIRRDGTVVWIHDSAVAVESDGMRFARGFVVAHASHRSSTTSSRTRSSSRRATGGSW